MKKFSTVVLLIMVVTLLAACSKSKSKGGPVDQLAEPEKGDQVAIMHTNYGDISIRLFPEQAPKTVENFVTHAKDGYYDGLIFHRVIKDFMVQGGDPDGTGAGGESIWGGYFEDEFHDTLFNYRGALSMANTARPKTNGSQFFIVQAGPNQQTNDVIANSSSDIYTDEVVARYAEIGGTSWLDQRHTVFGQVFEGMEVVDTMAKAETAAQDRPVEDIIIESIDVVEWEK